MDPNDERQTDSTTENKVDDKKKKKRPVQPDDFFDYRSKPTLFHNVKKDENDQFPLKLIKKQRITHDTFLFRLKFPKKNWISGLWVGGHFAIHGKTEKGDSICRKYTPISHIHKEGYVDFAIKIYSECPEFPDGGKMGKYLSLL